MLNYVEKYRDMIVPAHIHSLGGKIEQVTILGKVGDNQYVAEYNGTKCSAIYNPFAGWYADDKYGIITED